MESSESSETNLKTEFLPDGITLREREVARLICLGESSKRVAALMEISIKTVDTHRARLMKKSNSRNVVALVWWALRNGIVSL